MNKLIRIIIYVLFSLFFIFTAYAGRLLHIHEEFFFLFIVIIIFVLLPVFDVLISLTQKLSHKSIRPETFIETIDSIIQLETIDELLNYQFSKILSELHLDEGIIFFHQHNNRQYTIFKKTLHPDTLTRLGKLSTENILLKVLETPQDIIVRSKLGANLSYERALAKEMDKLQVEIMIPMFFSHMLTGAILFKKRKLNYSAEEISGLRIFASKLATLLINSLFWKEMSRKFELEKEKRLEHRVQKSFLPDMKLVLPKTEIAIVFKMTTTLLDRFFNIFSYKGTAYLLSYRFADSEASPLLFLPTVSTLIESYIRRGIIPQQALDLTKTTVTQKMMFDRPPRIQLSWLDENGDFCFINETQNKIYIYRKKKLEILKTDVQLKPGEFCIFTGIGTGSFFEEWKGELEKLFNKISSFSTQQIKQEVHTFLRNQGQEESRIFFGIIKYVGKK